METFTEEESYRIAEKMRERRGYSWVEDSCFFDSIGIINLIRDGDHTRIYLLVAHDIEDLRKKWGLETLSIVEETISLD